MDKHIMREIADEQDMKFGFHPGYSDDAVVAYMRIDETITIVEEVYDMAMKSDVMLIQQGKDSRYWLSVPVARDAKMQNWHPYVQLQEAISDGIAVLDELAEPGDLREKITAKQAQIAELEAALAVERETLADLGTYVRSPDKALTNEDIVEISELAPLVYESFTDKEFSLTKRYGSAPVLVTLSKIRDKDGDGNKDMDITFSWQGYKLPR